MEKKDVIFLDCIPVVSTPGTWRVDSLELAPREEEEDDKFGFEKARRRGRENAKFILDFYKTGKYDSRNFYVEIHKDEEQRIEWLDFVLKAEIIPDEIWDKLKDNIPQSPCIYSGCVSVANPIMTTYRDVYGSIGRSWETPFVQLLQTESCCKVADIKHIKGAFEAGIEVIRILHGESDDDDANKEVE